MSDDTKPEIPETAPWYAKTAMQTAVNFGVPTLMLLAIMLFWAAREVGWAPNPVSDQLEEIMTRLDKIDSNMQQDAGHAIRHDATMQEMVRILQEEASKAQVKCVLSAKTDAEKKACLHK